MKEKQDLPELTTFTVLNPDFHGMQEQVEQEETEKEMYSSKNVSKDVE